MEKYELLASSILTAKNSSYNRNINLKIVASRINGIKLNPGQKFNWWNVVGMMTKSQGYTEAIAYVNGNNVMSIGGGVCQVSTNLYQCAKKANMNIIERHTHGKEVTYIKGGQDATVTYGLRNLIFQNIYRVPIKINVTTYENITICKFYKIIQYVGNN